MRSVQSRPRYRCDYCRYVATESAVARHEKICWKNPDRICPACSNTGFYDGGGTPEYGYEQIPCHYCTKRWDAAAEEIEL